MFVVLLAGAKTASVQDRLRLIMLQREIQLLEAEKLQSLRRQSDYGRGFTDGLAQAIEILRNLEEADMDAMAAHYDQT